MLRWLAAAVMALWTGTATAEPPKPLVIYTATAATTAQAPVLGALAEGWAKDRAVEIRAWKDLDDLRGVILSGRGDVWIGHLDGFAQAARRGAPVVLLAVTAWSEKFAFLTLDPAPTDGAGLLAALAARGEALAVVPQGSPAQGFVENVEGLKLRPMPPQQAGLELSRGSVRHMLVPEPLASALLARFAALRRAGSVADLVPGEPHGLPMAGVAVRAGLAAEDPELAAGLAAAMRAWAVRHADDPAAIAATLPTETRAAIGEAVLSESLHHDPLLVVDAAEARDDVIRALRIIDGPHPVAEGFFFSP
jgi:NitT/TauT family transport system substrate-binding protein